jgi:sugar phosphate isomerase/epimerase
LTNRPVSYIATPGYEKWESPRVAESLLAAGYDAVEWTAEHVDSLLMPATAIACHQDLVNGGEAAVEFTLHAIDAAAEAGVPVLNVLTGPNLWEGGSAVSPGDEQAWSVALRALERICAHGEGAGVKIGFEPCWGTLAHDANTARRVLDAVPVSVCFDPSHFVMTGDPIPELIEEWGERIVHFHLKDAFGRPGIDGEDFIFCMLGEGLVPWPEVFGALDRVGYEGALSVEFEAHRYYQQVLGEDPEAAARLCRGQVAALLGERA